MLNAVRDSADIETDKAHIARGFQDALIGSLVEKTYRAAEAWGRERIVLGGGVACNSALASAMRERMDRYWCYCIHAVAASGDGQCSNDRDGPDCFTSSAASAPTSHLNAFASQPIPGLVAA